MKVGVFGDTIVADVQTSFEFREGSVMKRCALVVLTILLSVSLTQSQTNISGTINKDTTWTLAASPYVVIGSVTIGGGYTLTVDSGVVVQFRSGTGLYLNGAMNARHAVFTSAKDTALGNPQRGDWQGLQFGGPSWSPTVVMDTCVVQFGGASISGMVYHYAGTSTVTGSIVTQSSNHGVYARAGAVTLESTAITSLTNHGIVMQAGVSVVVSNGVVSSTNWAFWLDGTSSLVFDGTTSFSGNTHDGIYMSFTSMGTMTLDTVNIPFVFPSTMTVGAASMLTVAPGNVLKFGDYTRLNVDGALVANAGPGESIYITSFRNDNLPVPGSDTNADGTLTLPASSIWYGVLFNPGSADSANVMRRCKVTFGGYASTGGITMDDASPTIDSCDLASNYYGAMMQGVSSPVFTNNTIGSSQLVPIAMSFAANPVFLNNTFSFSDNQYDAIGLLGGTLPADAVLPIRSVTSIPNVTYLMLGSVTVPSTRMLTINKGIVIKSYSYDHRITVQGKLVADATADSMITFTSSKDDVYGNPGDSNRDGTQSVPARGDWGGIIFESGSDSTSILDYCRIKYGSLPGYVYYINGIYLSGGQVTTINASPTISNCEIKDVVYGLFAFSTSKPKVWNSQFINTQYTPIALSVSADPSFSGNTFTNTTWRALGIIGEQVGASGVVRQRTVAGIVNITYVLLADLTINSGSNVSVDPGVVIKSGGPGFYVNGGFMAKGTQAGGSIVFTSLKDDNFGNPGDTNGDGNATAPARGDWETIRYQATSDDGFSLLDSVIIKFAGRSGSWGGVTYTDAGSTISNSSISDSYGYGVRCEGSSTPNVFNVTIANSRLDPIAMSLKSNPTFTLITFSANGSQGIRILEGTLSSDATLAKRDVAGISNIAYIVDNLTISPNAVLTIEPGVVIKLSNYYSNIIVQGGFVAKGLYDSRIVFTSIMDDSRGGDTNNDGNGSAPSRGNWSTIDFQSSSADTLNELRNCVFSYGGGGYYAYDYTYGIVRVYSTTVVMDSCSFEQSATSGLGVFGSADPTVSNSSFTNIEHTPVTMSLFSSPTFGGGNTALNIGTMALGIKPETFSVDATVPVRHFAGYDSITYYLWGTLTINTGTVITVPAGLVFKDGTWQVNGGLKVLGTADARVIFTDRRDDTYGRPLDTNGDGVLTSPAINGGNIISFADVSSDSLSRIQYAVFRYRDAGVYLAQASPRVRHSLFNRTNWGLYLTGVSNPVVDTCTFTDLTRAPMRLSLVSYPQSSEGNEILGTTFRAIGVLENETLVQDVTLPKRTFGGVDNIPYLFGTYTIASNAILTVEPGVIMKFLSYATFRVRKGFIAEGGSTPDSLIVMTDYRDDFHGGDTNADSTASSPGSIYDVWAGIVFEDEALDPLIRVSHAAIRWSGYYYSTYAAITTNNASPTITNVLFAYAGTAVRANGSSNPVVNYCDFTGITNFGVNNTGGAAVIDARWNWWGSNSGPTHSSNLGGTGVPVSDNVDFTPWIGTGAGNPIMGDVSLNGSVQAFDASLVLKFVVNASADTLTGTQQSVADVSGTGGISAYDASLILQYVVGTIQTFPASRIRQEDGSMLVVAEHTQPATGIISVASMQAERGDRISIPLRLLQSSGVRAAALTLRVDPSMLRFVGIAGGSGLNQAYAALENGSNIRVAFASTGEMASEMDLAVLLFEIPKDIRGHVVAAISVENVVLNEAPATAVSDGQVEISGKPVSFELMQNFPNPFNPRTTIRFDVPEDDAPVRIIVYNSLGQRVRTLLESTMEAGAHQIEWDGRDEAGRQVASGLYIYRLTSGSIVQVRRMTMLK